MRSNKSTMPRIFGRLALAGLLGLWLVQPQGAGLGPEPGDGPRQTELRHVTGVTLKLVQVYVTGKDGKPVTDLAAGDFALTDNGKAVPITHFEKHFVGSAEDAPAVPAESARMNRKFFLFFDFAFMDQRGMVRAKSAGLHFLDSEIRPTDEVGLLSYTPTRGLTLHEYFTNDHQRVRRIVDGFGLKHVAGRAESLANFLYSADLSSDEVLPGGEFEAPDPEEAFYSKLAQLQTGQKLDAGQGQRYVDQVRQLMDTLRNLAKVLRYIPGYKNIIFFSGGVARQVLFGQKGGYVMGNWQTVDELAQEMSTYDAAQAESGLSNEFRAALKELDASNCPVYTVDVSPVVGDVDASFRGGITTSVREIDGEDSLRHIAGETGGKFYGSTVDYKKAVEDIKSTTSAYYVLGYTLDDKMDGKYHKIKVKVDRKGAKVFSQAGYYGLKPFREFSSFEKLLHMTDLALSDNPKFGIPAELPLRTQPLLVKGWMQAAAFMEIPKDLAADVIGRRAEAYLIVFDENDSVVSIREFNLIPFADGMNSLFPVFVVPIKPGTYSFRMVVRNRETGIGARGASTLAVPESAPQSIWLDPPLLLRKEPASADVGGAPEATLSALYGYDVHSYAPLMGPIQAGAGPLHVALRSTTGISGEMDISVALINAGTSARMELPITILGQEQDGNTRHFLLALETSEAVPGKYQLYFVARERGGPAGAYTTLDVVIE